MCLLLQERRMDLVHTAAAQLDKHNLVRPAVHSVWPGMITTKSGHKCSRRVQHCLVTPHSVDYKHFKTL